MCAIETFHDDEIVVESVVVSSKLAPGEVDSFLAFSVCLNYHAFAQNTSKNECQVKHYT